MSSLTVLLLRFKKMTDFLRACASAPPQSVESGRSSPARRPHSAVVKRWRCEQGLQKIGSLRREGF